MTEPPRLRRITAEEHGEGWTIYLASSKNAVWMRHTRDEKPKSINHIEAEYMNTETLLRDSDLHVENQPIKKCEGDVSCSTVGT